MYMCYHVLFILTACSKWMPENYKITKTVKVEHDFLTNPLTRGHFFYNSNFLEV